jgi:type II secretory pathway component GspD/PulD (secretin)
VKAKKWLGVVAGLALPAAGVGMAQGPAPLPAAAGRGADVVVCQQLPRSRASTTLNDAIDNYVKGDYEAADAGFKQAQASANDLDPQQQGDLSRFTKLNAAALQHRAEAADLVSQAEKADREGKGATALDFAKKALANQYVSPADRQKARDIINRVSTTPAGATAAGATGATPGSVMAKGKLAQARKLFAEGNLDAAEQLAREADRAGAAPAPGEESPKKLLDDIAKTRQDATALLTLARAALTRGDLERAEFLAKQSKKVEPIYSVHLWGDSPSKVLDEVEAARTAKKRAAEKEKEVVKRPPVEKDTPKKSADKPAPEKDNSSVMDSVKGMFGGKKPDAPPAPPAESPKVTQATEQARQLVQQGRKALKDGQIDKAEDCARRADALKPNLQWWEEDNPAKLLADCASAKAARGGTAKASERTPPADPKALLRQAHQALDQGKFDDALALAQRAKVAPGAKDAWGLLDFDTPDKLIAEVNKARTKRNQEEAGKLLAQGRELLQQAQADETHRGELLDRSQQLALKADTLRAGNYSVWEMGDRPSKLLADIDTERKKGRAKVVPPVPPLGSAVAANDGAGRWPAGQPDDARIQQARRAMNEARTAAHAGNTTVAASLVASVERMNLPADRLGSDSPAAVRRELALVSTGTGPDTGLPPVTTPTGRPTPTDRAGNAQAREMVAEARRLQAQGHLLEARAKLLEAQRLPAVFGPDEDRPEKALLDLASAARRQIDRLETQADDDVHHGAADVQKFAEAQTLLAQAQALARGFQLDTYLLDKKLAWVQQKRSAGAVARVDNPNPLQQVAGQAKATDGEPQKQGQRLLDQARMEIQHGHNGEARRLVEIVYAGNYGLKADAENLLRGIDIEEYEQKRRDQQRTFDAGRAAFNRHDYQIAGQLLRAVDVKMLTPQQQAQMRELMRVPELQPENVQVVAKEGPPTLGSPGDGPGAPGRGHVSDMPDSRESTYLQQVEAMRSVKMQKMRDEQFRAEKEANKLANTGDTEHAIEVLQEFLSRVPESGLDPNSAALVRRPVETKLQQYRTLDAQNRIKYAQDGAVRLAKHNHEQKGVAEQTKQARMKELMDKYNDLYKKAKYREAEVYAMQAHDLDPDDPTAGAAMQLAKMAQRVADATKLKNGKENTFLQMANDSENEGPALNTDDPIHIDPSRHGIALERLKRLGRPIGPYKSAKEREIEHALDRSVSLSFNNVPLGTVIDQIRSMQDINVLPDMPALTERGISMDLPVTFQVDNMTLKSALKNLLNNVRLTYVVEDEALKITTPDNAKGKLVRVPYQVTDLVIPVADSGGAPPPPLVNGSPAAQPQAGSASPVTGPFAMQGGQPTGSPGGTSTFGTGGAGADRWDLRKGVSQTKEDQLIQLLQNAIEPKSWAQMGGQGTIDYFPMTMTLVINQTPDIQEQIADLLEALRRLQDAEVAVELRLISIAEGFFERIGVDFNVNIVNDKGTQKFQPMITSGQFKPAGFINDFTPNRFLSGLTPAETFTSDLGIPITTSSFGMAIPPFGGFPNAPGSNGGLDVGLAFLSDIQVFLFLEAAQGDQRTNVMQAPKITLFNGQNATLSVSDQQSFVTSASVTVVNGQPVFTPNNQTITTGVSINVQAVISADRRFVRMNFSGAGGGITLTNLASAVVPLFPIVQLVPTVLDGGVTTNPVAFTQFFQQPVFNSVSVVTTVMVPDGGTVLMGGLKRLSEGRNEFGPPVLSKIPYLDRLFRNVGYGREVQNLMMMVTPRIIINEEEEFRQTGVTRPEAAGPR